MSEIALTNADMSRLPTPSSSLEAYVARISQIPVLSAPDEQALARRLRDEGDLAAAQQLVLSNLRFVVHIARGYKGYGLGLGDLIQEGNIGLMKAVKRFDPEQGVRLVSFAVHWIRAEIHEFILRNWRIVKVATTKAQRKLFFKLRGAKKRLGWFSDEEVQTVAEDLGVPVDTVREMESRLSGQDCAWDADGDDEDDAVYAPSRFVSAAEESDPARAHEAQDWQDFSLRQLHQAMASLDERSRDIIMRRWISEPRATLQEMADEYGVSAERIRQLENNAVKRMRAAISQAA